MKKLRVLILNHPDLAAPESRDGSSVAEAYVWKTEFDVAGTLAALGHEVRKLHVADELVPIREVVEEWKPHVVFNLLEEFHGMAEFDTHVVSYLELLRVPYTGCNPRGLMLARGKALAKKIMTWHRIRTPGFAVFARGRRIGRLPRGVKYPAIVKSLTEESSLGISQASIVEDADELVERVTFIHERIGSDAIVEEYIEGRELYVGVLGNERLKVFPVWEMIFEKLPKGAAAIATEKVKHDVAYQEKAGIFQEPARNLDEALLKAIARTTKRAFRALELSGYARIDYRLAPTGELYFLEANPNPEVAQSEEFASAAAAGGLAYPELIGRIVSLGLARGG